MTVRRGDVVLVGFPFTDLTATKVRPALVVSATSHHRSAGDVLLAAISSAPPRRARASHVVVKQSDRSFAATGLRKSSVVLCGKLFTMEQRLVLRHLGRLGAAQMKRVDRGLAAVLGLTTR